MTDEKKELNGATIAPPVALKNPKYYNGQIVRFFKGDVPHYGRVANMKAEPEHTTYLVENGVCFFTVIEEEIDTVYVNQDQSKNG